MARQCTQCHKEYSLDCYTCESCGADLIDNGQLVDALTFWENKNTSIIKAYLVPLGLVTVSGILAAAFDSHLVLYFGIAAAIFYYTKQNKK